MLGHEGARQGVRSAGEEYLAPGMPPTDVGCPDYFHKVVDCQWACPAHTPVPEYIRLIAAGRYTDAYMVNWTSNVFPGILGRTCDRPCEPACRRGRVEAEPVAICRLKRVAADNKGDLAGLLPKAPATHNGKRVALIGAGPASLTVARDLAPLGYAITLIDSEAHGGGMIRSQIPRFRLPETVIDEEVGYIISVGGIETRFGQRVESLRTLLTEGFDAIFVGTGAPRGRDLEIPGRREAAANIHIGIDWLSNVSFGHVDRIGRRVVVLGGGNTAMDCCRTARRLGGVETTVVARRSRPYFKASPWELEDAEEETIHIVENHAPKRFVIEQGKLVGMEFEQLVWSEQDGKQISTVTGTVILPCDEVILAIGQDNAFPWIERDIGIAFDKWGMPVVDKVTMESTRAGVFFGGDAAWGPQNIIWAVEHGHQAAISIHQHCEGRPVTERPPQGMHLASTKMGMHAWAYSNDFNPSPRAKMQHAELVERFSKLGLEVELGFTAEQTATEVERCLNCDIETHFASKLCIECDACVDVCPVSCLTITPNVESEFDLRQKLSAPALNLAQPLYVSENLPQTKRVMVKDEDICLHCGLCAERCPTAAWDMAKFALVIPYASALDAPVAVDA
jgi:formate dehydrogenase beta subunit